MKKLGLLIAVACLAQGAIANSSNTAPVNIPNLAVLVAETGASTRWTPEMNRIDTTAEKHLGLKAAEVREKLDAKIEERFQTIMKAHQFDI